MRVKLSNAINLVAQASVSNKTRQVGNN